MQYQSKKVPLYVTNNIIKIDQLLRMYDMCKKSDISLKNTVNKKINQLLRQIQNQTIYHKILEFVNQKIFIRLQDPKIVNKDKIKQMSNQKLYNQCLSDYSIQKNIQKNYGINNQQNKCKEESVDNNSFNKQNVVQQKNKYNSQDNSRSKSQHNSQQNNQQNGIHNQNNSQNNLNSNIQHNQNNLTNLNNNIYASKQSSVSSFSSSNSHTSLNNFLKIVQKQNQKEQKQKYSNNNYSISVQKSSQSQNQSSQSNDKTISQFIKDNINNIQKILIINDDLFSLLKQIQQKYVFAIGINIPQRKNIQKLYICTLMKFMEEQILTFNYADSGQLQKQNKTFQNNLRCPIGLVINGKSLDELQIQHIKFLIELRCKNPIIIFIQSLQQRKGFLITFTKEIVKIVKDLNKIQYSRNIQEIRNMLNKRKISLSKIPIIKQRLIITKNLTRVIKNVIEPVKNAIQIQASNQLIKQQMNHFPYKLHTKFYVSSKSEYQVFFIQNLILSIKISYKQKQFDIFKKFVIQQARSKGKFILSTSVMKQTSEIKKQFFKVLYQFKNRDQYFIVNFSGINNKKTLILTLKQTVSEEYINGMDMVQFKDLQKDHQLTNLVVAVNKQNYKNYQTDSKVQVVDLTIKKK